MPRFAYIVEFKNGAGSKTATYWNAKSVTYLSRALNGPVSRIFIFFTHIKTYAKHWRQSDPFMVASPHIFGSYFVQLPPAI